jgi:DNA-binding transcriptional LysR family regulator
MAARDGSMHDLRWLETFVWVVRLGSFRAAAARLNTTQPSVSGRIDQLEQHLGVALFAPPNRRTTLTREGTILLNYAEQLLATIAEMRTVIQQPDAVRGVLRLGVAETLVHGLMPRLLDTISKTYPQVVLDMMVDTTPMLSEQLCRGQIDVSMQVGPVADHRAVNQALCHFPLGWVASPALGLAEEPLPLAALTAWPVLSFSHNSPLAADIQRALAVKGGGGLRLWGSASLTLMVRMVQDGVGTAILPLALVREEIARGQLRQLEVPEVTLPFNGFQVSYLRRSESFLTMMVVEQAREIGRQLESEEDRIFRSR